MNFIELLEDNNYVKQFINVPADDLEIKNIY